MQNFKTLLLVSALSSLVSCVDAASRNAPRDTTPTLPGGQRIVNGWIGGSVTEMIEKLGAPTKTFMVAGKEYIVYVYTSTVTDPGGPGSVYRSGTGGYSYKVTDCTYTFEIRRGIIVGGNAVGSNCNR